MEEDTRLGYGIGLGLLAMGLFVVYVPVLVILFVDKEFRRSTAYIIMTHIGVMDVLQLLIHMYAAIAVIADIHIQSIIQKVIGALLTGLWFSMICFTIFLTFNRLSCILLERWFPILTSLYFNYVLFGVCYLSFIIPFLLKLLPFCNYVFNPRTFSWSYLPTDDVLSVIMSETSTYLLLVFVIASTITYASIFCYIGFFSSSKLSKREFRLTIQVSMIILYFLLSFLYWTFRAPLFGITTLSDYVSCIVWVVMNGIHPIIYLIFNHRLQYSFIYMLTHRKLPGDVSSLGQAAKLVKISKDTTLSR
nr:7TM GPCR domain containing protein [Haemonchus contortus]